MGILTDLVAATDADVERIARSQVPSQQFSGVDIKGIDTVKLGTLHSLLTGDDFEALLSQYDPVFEVSEDGPWVSRIPPALQSRLASMDATEMRRVADLWAATEEFKLDEWQPADVARVLESICTLATRADAAGQTLFLCRRRSKQCPLL